jgi:hypothetical protein
MNSEQIERANEQSQIALDGEMRMNQAGQMLKAGQNILAKTHLQQALHICERLLTELE